MKSSAFVPEWRSPPSDTLQDILEERGWDVHSFADAARLPVHVASGLLAGSVPISPDIAERLSESLGTTAAFWLSRQNHYESESNSPDDARLVAEWASEFPISDIVNFGWIRPTNSKEDAGRELLSFFAVDGVSTWRVVYADLLQAVTFRTSTSFISAYPAVAAWLRRGWMVAEQSQCAKWDAAKFGSRLASIRKLTRVSDPKKFLPELKALCAECGVAIVFARAPSGCRASGATAWIDDEKALLLLSFRFLSDDHFWFSFFHEAAHLLLHRDRRILVEMESLTDPRHEREADTFAAKLLIPEEWTAKLRSIQFKDTKEVLRTAQDLGISPGIMIGQMQHLGLLSQNRLNKFKRRYSWSELDGLQSAEALIS